jgi:signal transduction histidine kinase
VTRPTPDTNGTHAAIFRDVTVLEPLEPLLALPATDLPTALSQAADILARVLRADKVDAFLYDDTRASLVAAGTSRQPLSSLQRKLGLDVLALANGGRTVAVFRSGETSATGALERDGEELRGLVEALGIRSTIQTPFVVGGERRGVLSVASQKPDHFTPEDVRLVENAARMVGGIAHRAELVETLTKAAASEGRRAAAEEIVTVLAHDVRNYLAPLDYRLGRLRHRARAPDDIRDADLAIRALGRVKAVVDDLLDVARIDQGLFQVAPEPFEIGTLARDVATTFSTPERPIEVAVSEETVVLGDPKRLRQCIMNLLSNAVEHAPKGTSVAVSVSKTRRGGRELARIDIADAGPGIAPSVVPHVFERFVSKSVHGGLGLGLYLAKRIAEMHGGDLTVESQPGHGTRFTLCLPCYAES